jgi:hypothetical protein
MNQMSTYIEFTTKLDVNKLISFNASNLETNDDEDINLPDEIQNIVSAAILNYYKVFMSYEQIWTFKQNEEIRGFINILPLGNPIEDSKAPDQHGLTMFDNFVPEACVGYYVAPQGQKPNDELYFLNFGEEPQGMNVNADGYIQLLYMARGFAYWQMALLSFQNNPTTDENAVEEFRHWMPIVFPDFKWEEFVALYEKVKIK